jgi:outer membrane protein
MYHFRHALRSTLLVFALVAPQLGAQATSRPVKFAFVDTRVIIDRAPGASDVQATLDKERSTSMAKMQKMQDSLNTMIEAFSKEQATMADSVKTRRTKAIQDKQAEYTQRANEMDAAAQQRQQDLVQPILAQIREVLDKIRDEEGYTFIFDIGQGGGIVAADKNLDITDRVIARLKPVAVTTSPRPGNTPPSKSDSTVKPAPGAKPAPAGVGKPPKPPTS